MPGGKAFTDTDLSARFALVEEHIRLENARDLDGIMATFGSDARYEDEAWGERHAGLAAVRSYYETLLVALPDIRIDVKRRFASPDAVACETVISGTHLGPWRGIPATGRPVSFPLMAVYTFTDNNRLAGERIYYDRATVQRQLGLYREPETLAGRLGIAVMHPLTIVSAYTRQLLPRRR